ncbi:MAG: ATP-binding cassette domain-containing protein, partial [Planctomycetaceae bacterium]|nr:ATP-binding cassette domain-containing protein [Planctomycetaceae bacterium]
VFVTHDRVFLRKLSTRIIEVDRGRLLDWPCDYTTFLQRKEAALEVEAQHQALFDKKLALEEVWVRTGVKARRTRSEARVRELNKMREERRQRKDRVGNVRLLVQDAERSGRLVIEAKKIGFSWPTRLAPEDDGCETHPPRKPVLCDFSTLILRGDKIGVIGPNGSGKSVLLPLRLGQLTPTTGSVLLGTEQEVADFDQLREQLDEDKTAQENVGEGKQMLLINGQERHVLGYLQEFLFSPERARTLVRYLSGGERNRLMLAKLLTKPSNMLVLDEPTNDLDAETLELLEDLLIEYPGTVLLVSHDREFLNNVVSSTLVFEGDGLVKDYDGGYDDWQRQRTVSQTPTAFPETVMRPSKSGTAPRKLSFKEQRELESLPARIDQLETEQAALHVTMSAPSFYQQPKSDIAATSAKLEALERELATVFARWESLEAARS